MTLRQLELEALSTQIVNMNAQRKGSDDVEKGDEDVSKGTVKCDIQKQLARESNAGRGFIIVLNFDEVLQLRRNFI